MPSVFDTAMEILVSLFHSYSSKGGDKDKLSKKELKELLQNELGGLLETQRDPEGVDKIMCDLDKDGNGKISFEEFVKLLAIVLVSRNSSFLEET